MSVRTQRQSPPATMSEEQQLAWAMRESMGAGGNGAARQSQQASSEPFAHLTVLQSAPLISRGPAGSMHALPVLSLQAEREQLLETLRAAEREMSVRFETATTDALRAVMTMGTSILHWSGHGEEGSIAFEDGSGATHSLSPQLLADTCLAGDAQSTCRLVFVCACHSQPTARRGMLHNEAWQA